MALAERHRVQVDLHALPQWVLTGNSGDVHAWDAESGLLYLLLEEPPSPSGDDGLLHIATVDWASAVLALHPAVAWLPVPSGGKDNFKLIKQMAWV